MNARVSVSRTEGGQAVSGRARPRVEALARGLRILSLFSEDEPLFRLQQIADQTSIPLPTVFRLVSTLESEGYVERLPDQRVRPAPAVLTLGFAALRSLDLVQVCSPALHTLAQATGQTVNLAVLRGDNVLYLVRVRNTDLVTASVQVGSQLPAVFTSMGKVLLAELTDAELRRRLGPKPFARRSGPNAVTTLGQLRGQLATVRREGFALQDEEVAAGLRSVAGPVRDATGAVVGAINIAVQAAFWPVEAVLAELAGPLLETCSQVSRALGAPRPGRGGGATSAGDGTALPPATTGEGPDDPADVPGGAPATDRGS